MRLEKFKDIGMGEPFLFMNKLWTRSDFEAASEMFNSSCCGFDIEATCVFVIRMGKEDVRAFLNGEKSEKDFLSNDDIELMKVCEIIEDLAKGKGLSEENWVLESNVRKEFIHSFMYKVDNLHSLSDRMMDDLSIAAVKEWYERQEIQKKLNNFASKEELAACLNNLSIEEVKKYERVLDTPNYSRNFKKYNKKFDQKEIIDNIKTILFGD